MLKRKIGDFDASVVAFGAWAIGGWMWGGTEKNESVRAIQVAVDSGINMIDTAPVYGFGVSEEIVGEAIKVFRRDEVIVATKCGLIWHEAKGTLHFESDDKGVKGAGGGDVVDKMVYKCLTPENIRYEVEQSLQRLGVDYIDLYQTHWQDTTTPIEESMEVLLELKKEGKIRAIGCSNATPEEMLKYLSAGKLDADQEKYSMLDRALEEEGGNLDFVADNDVAFLAYSPLSQGLLTGKVGPDRVFEKSDQRNYKKRFDVDNRARVAAMLDEFKPVAAQHGINLGQLAIAWTFHQKGCSHVLIGARTPEQAAENAAAGEVQLSEEDINIVREAIIKHGADII